MNSYENLILKNSILLKGLILTVLCMGWVAEAHFQLLPPANAVELYKPDCLARANLEKKNKESIATMVEIADMPFSEAVKIRTVFTKRPASKDTQLTVISDVRTQKGKQVYLIFYHRIPEANPNQPAYFELTLFDGNNKEIILDPVHIYSSSKWQQYAVSISPKELKYGVNKISAVFSFGKLNTPIELGGLQAGSVPDGTCPPDLYSIPEALQFPHEVSMGKTAHLDVLKNAKDPTGAALKVVALPSKPKHGTACIRNNKVVYTSDKDFFGIDQFEYTVADKHGNTATANIKLLVRHDFSDGTWHIGNDPAIYSGSPRKQFFVLSDEYHSPAGSFELGRLSPRHYTEKESFSDPTTDFHYVIFGKMSPDGTKHFPAGWTWCIPNEKPTGNFKWAGIRLGGNEFKRIGYNRRDIVEWKFNFEVENYSLGYRRAILINTYWYKDPDRDETKVMDLGIYFTDKEVMKQKMGPDVKTVTVDGREVFFKPKIKRFFIIVDDFNHFTVKDFDMAPYIRYVEETGLNNKEGYFWKGCFDVELKHKAYTPAKKTVGEFYIHNFSSWVHLDMAPKTPIGNKVYALESGSHKIPLDNVFQHVGGYAREWDEEQKVYNNVPPTITYTVSNNSQPTLIDASIKGSSLTLTPMKTGSSTFTIRATDHLNRWYDEEVFQVKVQ